MLMLGTLRLGVRRRGEVLPLGGRQRLILGPGVAQVPVALLARRLGEGLVVLARLAALLGREARPRRHALLHALCALGFRLGIALGNGEPLLPALGLQRV